MLKYVDLKEKPSSFLAATGITDEEFQALLPNFETAYRQLYATNLTFQAQPRRRSFGGGREAKLASFADRLLFILNYQKTNPLQTMHGLSFGLSQGQVNYWIHRLLPVLRQALAAMGMTPERDGAQVATASSASEGGANLSVDGTERRIHRPVNAEQQKAKYSGKKKAHTDKNILLVNENTKKVVYLSATTEGKKHDKKLAEESLIRYPKNASLTQDTGFQGYQPKEVLVQQPKKSKKSSTDGD